MKKLIVLAMIGLLAMPVYAIDLDSMTTEELMELDKQIHEKLLSQGEYPYEEFEDYEDFTEYHIGDTWETPGLYKITINSVKETDQRTDYRDEDPEAVYIVNYTYENLGYNYISDLEIELQFDCSIIDADGELGYTYGGLGWNGNEQTKKIPIGSRISITQNIGVNHAGSFMIRFNVDGNNHDDHIATFVIDPQ